MGFKYLELNANNVPASGKISHARGFPTLSFTIGKQNAVLDMSSIRLSGKLDIWRDTAGTLRPEVTSTATAKDLRASNKLGVYGFMDSLTWRHAESKQICESIKSFQRFMSSYLPIMSSKADNIGHMGMTALTANSLDNFRDSVIYRAAGASGASEFCVPLPCGMTLGGNKVPLNQLPLDLELGLAPDSAFFFSATGLNTGLTDCFYELSDVKLFCEVYEPEPNEMASMLPSQGAFSFNSISSYFTTIESTQSIINFRLGLSKVLSAFVNFIPSSFVNNLVQDQSLTYMPAAIVTGAGGDGGGAIANLLSVTFLKNGQRLPYHYELLTNYDNDKETTVVDSQVIKNFMSSIVPESQHVRTMISPNNCNRNYAVNSNAASGYKAIPDGGAIYGVGAEFDAYDNGIDFSSEQFSIHMNNELTDGTPNSAYLFIKSKQTIAFKDGQIQVIA